MTTYNLNLISKRNAIVILIVFLIFYAVATVQMIEQKMNENFKILGLLILMFLFTIRTWIRFTTAKIKLTINENAIYLEWIKQFPFVQQDDKKIFWNEIMKITGKFNRPFSSILFNFTNGKKLKFETFNFKKEDELIELKNNLKTNLSIMQN